MKPANPEVADEVGRRVSKPNRTPAGGFRVEFRDNGAENRRAFYERETRTIFINLEHPQLVAARAGADEHDPTFKRLSFEVAFTEYAIGFVQEHASISYYRDFDEPLFDMRDRLDTLSRRAAHLFRPL